jgi:hypothetical protein
MHGSPAPRKPWNLRGRPALALLDDRCWQSQGGATGCQAPMGSQQLEHRGLVSAGCELESLSKTQAGQPQGIRQVGSAIYQRMVSCLVVGSLAPDSLGANISYIRG